MSYSLAEEVKKLEEKVKKADIPQDLREKTGLMLDRLARVATSGVYSAEYESINRYVEWIISLPWQNVSDDILDIGHVKKILDKNHYGLEELKERILEYVSVLSLKRKKQKVSHAPILCLVGLVGTGKTTLAISIAEAIGREFARVPFGGLGDPLQLRGQARVHTEAEPGQIIKSLRRAQTKNPVILLDEIDRVVESARGDIMGVLVELLDPEQNEAFLDYYIDYPFNLSEVLFITTANNTTNIATAVLDRLEILTMPSYTDDEKIVIGKDYIFPRAIEEAGLDPNSITIGNDLWPKIVRPLGYDAGMRSLERTIETICRKVAKLQIEGKSQQLNINSTNAKEYLPTW